jgi:hypothetical protein
VSAVISPKAVATVTLATGITAGQLIFTGACLAIGFSLGHLLMRKISEAYDGKKFSDLEQQAPSHA